MDWYSFGDASKEFGKAVGSVLCVVFIYVLSFKWMTAPIFMTLFPETLVNVHGDDEVLIAIFLWIVAFVFHISAFAYVTGMVMTNRDKIKKSAKNLLGRIQDARSRTD